MKQLVGHNRPTGLSFSAKSAGWVGGFVLLFAGCWLRAADLPPSVTLDLPIPANQATPLWLGHPVTPPATFATLNLPILAPDPNASLLVTVYFQEKQGGFMRISWIGTDGAQVLSDNFCENIGMSNQRSLLVSPSTLIGDGMLSFQCGDSVLGIQRIKLEWLASKESLVSPEVQDTLVTPSVGATQGSQTLNGQANPTEPGAWQNQLVTVPLTDTPLRIEQGVDFSVDLDKVPGSARLALKETGLQMGKHLVVWINDQRAGSITPAVPDLLDGGFLNNTSSANGYVGWRDGSFYVPVTLLKEGVNTVQLSDEADADLTPVPTTAPGESPETPLAVKGMTLQLNYFADTGTVSTPAPDPAPDSASDPTGAIEPHLSMSPVETLPVPPDSSSTPPDTTP